MQSIRVSKSRAALALTCVLAFTSFTFVQEDEVLRDDSRPRILVTNDDGIQAPGLKALVQGLGGFADVYVCAPEDNRSGSSQSITYLGKTLTVTKTAIEGSIMAVAISGTPADATHFGLHHFGGDEPFDLVVSGMNHGANVGEVSHESGTVGAAMEGAYAGVPSVAVSVDARTRDFEPPAKFAAKFAQELLEREADASIVYSINMPPRPKSGWRGVQAAAMKGAYVQANSYRQVQESEGDSSDYRARVEFVREFPEGSDSKAYMDGYVTITPLRFDWTDHDSIEAIAGWGLTAD